MSGAPPPPRLRQRAAKVEYLAYLSIALSISMAAAKGPTYNLAVALLNLFSSHTRRGRHLFASMVCIVASIVIDIIRVVAVTFDDFNDTFAFIMIIGNIVAKVLILGFSYGLFVGLGGLWSLSDSAVQAERADSFVSHEDPVGENTSYQPMSR